jgi:hypothetical protein
MTDKTLADLSDLELERANQALMRERDKVRAEQRKIADEQNRRATDAKAQALLEGLSDSQRDVVVKAVAAAAKVAKGQAG